MVWDRGIKYNILYKEIVSMIKEFARSDKLVDLTRLAYSIILLIQLRNGSRISEAIEFAKMASQEWMEKGYVRVRKKKSQQVKRLMIMPKEINKALLRRVSGIILTKKDITLQRNVTSWAYRYLSKRLGTEVNTHTLRYARITYMSEKGLPAQLIAKITKHSKLETILRYIQEKEAERLLEEIE